jgi:hypothetical protein
LVGEGECGAGELAGSWVFGGGGEFGLREAGFVVPEWGALGQRPADEGHRPVEVAEGDEDERGAGRRPAGEQVEVFGEVEGG